MKVRVCEAIYDIGVTDKESIHVLDWPLVKVHHHPNRLLMTGKSHLKNQVL